MQLDDYDDAPDWDDDWWDDDESAETIECLHCGDEIYEEAEQCPHCGKYISREDAPAGQKPWWIVAGVVVCLYLVFRWIMG